MHNDDDEWGNLGDFDANDVFANRPAQNRLDRGVEFKMISPTGEEFIFRWAKEADEFFKFKVSHLIPLKGAKSLERRKLRNWIIVRLDGSASNEEIEQLKAIVEQKVNPTKKVRDNKAWAKKMENWRNSEDGKKYNKKRKSIAYKMGKKNSQPIMTPDGEFESARAAARYYKITRGSMASRMRHNPDKYYKILKENNNEH